jgi:SAM-dependent methyltransferase
MSTPDEMGLTAEAAQGYERLFVPAIFRRWSPVLLEAAGVEPGHDLLDAGCGTGAIARDAVKVVGDHGSVAGIDKSASMLRVARDLCPTAAFRQGDVAELPYTDGSFDVVVSSFMLMFVPDPVQAIREMRRVLRPGGRLAVSVWEGLPNNPVYRVLVDATRDVVDDAAADTMAWPFALGDPDRLHGIFDAAGVPNVSLRAREGGADFSSAEEFVYAEVRAWLLADRVNADQMAELASRVRARCAGFVDGEGIVRFPLNALLATFNA